MAATWFSVQPLLAQYGFTASFNLISGGVGGTFEGLPLADWKDWRWAYSLGHELASHGVNHVPMVLGWNGLRADLIRLFQGILTAGGGLNYLRHVIRTMVLLKNHPSYPEPYPSMDSGLSWARHTMMKAVPGCTVKSFVYPAGRYNRHAEQKVIEAGYHSARGLDLGWNQPDTSRFRLKAVPIFPTMPLSDISRWLDRALYSGGWLILVFHLVSQQNPTQYPFYMPLQQFEQLLTAVKTRPFWVATQSQVADYLFKS